MNSDERAAAAGILGAALDECRDRLLNASATNSWDKPGIGGGRDVVTDLDLWVEDRLTAAVRGAYPGCAVLSEESLGDPSSLRSPLCFVIDPIDGTAEFLIGDSSFAVSVAVVCEGRVEVGLVDFPKQGLRYEARRGEGAWAAGRQLKVPDRKALAGASVAVTPRQLTSPELQPAFACLQECELVEMRPVTAKLAALSAGEVDAGVYLAHPGSELAVWDYAAAGMVLEEAGGAFVSLADRRPIMEKVPIRHREGWVASSRSLLGPLLDTIDEGCRG